jgi:hypothetical protein
MRDNTKPWCRDPEDLRLAQPGTSVGIIVNVALYTTSTPVTRASNL